MPANGEYPRDVIRELAVSIPEAGFQSPYQPHAGSVIS
jgi:hypothetical protein